MAVLRHIRARWPDTEIPDGEPEWLLYEIDDAADAVVRSVEVYPDGSITRNSIEIEERTGVPCPSLIHCSVEQGFAGADFETLSPDEFDDAWRLGVDQPFWTAAPPDRL